MVHPGEDLEITAFLPLHQAVEDCHERVTCSPRSGGHGKDGQYLLQDNDRIVDMYEFTGFDAIDKSLGYNFENKHARNPRIYGTNRCQPSMALSVNCCTSDHLARLPTATVSSFVHRS